MTTKHILLMIGCLVPCTHSGLSQGSIPGGVADPAFWRQVNSDNDIVYWENTLEPDSLAIITTASHGFVNYNVACQFDADFPGVEFELPGGLETGTAFCVYTSPARDAESVVWTASRDGSTSLIMTTDRLARCATTDKGFTPM